MRALADEATDTVSFIKMSGKKYLFINFSTKNVQMFYGKPSIIKFQWKSHCFISYVYVPFIIKLL